MEFTDRFRLNDDGNMSFTSDLADQFVEHTSRPLPSLAKGFGQR